jgi:signal transduction histidine kinase/ActR/RegA family two-component response regulator
MRDETATLDRITELAARLEEAEETLRAVRSGEIDAFVIQGPQGEQVYALRSAEQPYRELVEDMLEGAAILTTDGDIAYCNRRFAELVAVPLEDVIGGSMERFLSGVDRPAYRAILAAGSGKRRTQLTTADGRTVDVFLSFTTSVCDEMERRNLIITDLSELLDAQSGRDRAEQQSQAKDEFMAMLAHELRNPLSAITAAVQVLEAAQGHEKHTARARAIIGRQAQHLSRLVDDLLDVGRVVTGKITLERHAVDFCELVRRTAAVFVERESGHHIEIRTEPVWIEGDAVRIEQIVSNIVGNAVKYTPTGGSIRVFLSVDADSDEAVLRVEDNGFGITSELLPVVFDLFVQGERTLERAQGGLGIGLTLVRRLVTLHGGTVSVTSEGAGLGSVFTVRLPQVAAARTANSSGAAPRLDTMRRRVLIVEDNRDAREMFRMMLELSGHQVLEAEEGCRGLELLKSELPDIAFIDVGLPGLDGYEIARRFRCESCGTYVQLVALTGYGTPDALERSHRAGFDRHLIKPVTPETLYELLNANGTGSGSENGSGISNGNGLSNGTGGAGGPSGIGSASRNAIGRDSANPAGDHGGAASARRATGGNGGGGSGAATSLAARDVSLQ